MYVTMVLKLMNARQGRPISEKLQSIPIAGLESSVALGSS